MGGTIHPPDTPPPFYSMVEKGMADKPAFLASAASQFPVKCISSLHRLKHLLWVDGLYNHRCPSRHGPLPAG